MIYPMNRVMLQHDITKQESSQLNAGKSIRYWWHEGEINREVSVTPTFCIHALMQKFKRS
jgi:hypothetical protein